MPLQIYADGGYREAAGGVGGWGYLFLEEDGTLVATAGGVLVTDTPAGGEYTAIIKALRAAQDAGYREVEVYNDCSGVVNHLTGQARILSPRVIPLYLRATELLDGFAAATVEFVPRHHPGIRAADALGCEAVARETEAGYPVRWWHKSNFGMPPLQCEEATP
jgi:ribonuclease HI